MKGVSYAVLGCGDWEWTQTFHCVLKLVDSTLARLCAEQVSDIGLLNVTQGQVVSVFENWEDNV